MNDKLTEIYDKVVETQIQTVLKAQCKQIANDPTGEYFKQVQLLRKNGVLRIPNPSCWVKDTPLKGGRTMSAMYLLLKQYNLQIPFITDMSSQAISIHGTIILGDFISAYKDLINLKVDDVTIPDFGLFLIYTLQNIRKSGNAYRFSDSLLCNFITMLLSSLYSRDEHTTNIKLCLNDYLSIKGFQDSYNVAEFENRIERKPKYCDIDDRIAYSILHNVFSILRLYKRKKGVNIPLVYMDHNEIPEVAWFNLQKIIKAGLGVDTSVYKMLANCDDSEVKQYITYVKAKKADLPEYKVQTKIRENFFEGTMAYEENGLVHCDPFYDYQYERKESVKREGLVFTANKRKYNPCTRDYSIITPFSEVIVDYETMRAFFNPKDSVAFDQMIRDTYTCAQAVNQSRTKIVKAEKKEPLRVTFENVPSDLVNKMDLLLKDINMELLGSAPLLFDYLIEKEDIDVEEH